MWHGVAVQIRDWLELILDVILPPRERSLRMRTRTLDDLALCPTEHHLCGATVTTLVDYRTQAAQDSIRALKYDGSGKSATLLADALADYLREHIAQIHSFTPRQVLLVPMPLHNTRLRERGFNQTERVLRALPIEFRDGTLSRISRDGLVRIRATPPQTKLSRRERLQNVRGAFEADTAIAMKSHLIIIDDVVTTGATLSECTKIAKEAGAMVTALALARA